MEEYILGSATSAASYVNRIGKYLKQNLDGAYKITFKPNECIVYLRMFYELPDNKDSFQEMLFTISIVSYQNKIRMNITEDTMHEKTIGQLIFQLEELNDLHAMKEKFMKVLRKSIAKEYQDYYFVY